jgi:hypothetical protein
MGETKKGNGLAITALVLSALFFLPLVPLVGVILGIVALTTGRSKPISIVAICLGAFFTLTMGLYAAIAIPAFMKYVKRSQALEARATVRNIATTLRAADSHQWAALPDSEWTPAGSVCAQPEHKLPADPAAWQVEPWKTLGFSLDGASRYQYRVARESQGFRVDARGDLDCNGVTSLFTAHVTPDETSPITVDHDGE